MPKATRGVLGCLVAETPVAILDFETTGLYPGPDRIVEVSVARIEPGGAPEIVFDTLVNPRRGVSATHIHGIRDSHVADAPQFEQIARPLLHALSGAVVAGYNVSFDLGFLSSEFARIEIETTPPHICLMYLRPALRLGRRCSLGEACRAHAIPHARAHTSADDVLATSRLWMLCRTAMEHEGIQTFRDLKRLGSYKFLQSFRSSPLSADMAGEAIPTCRLKSRSGYNTSDTRRTKRGPESA